ncbi:hypothetical protein B0H14DRAFT_3038971 [Mycena olivaceomarginata]|nr:hypothetical protein B0H14DRAFT_3038971 [Mycena olivaceomarginata]
MYLSTKLLAYVPLAIIAATAKPTGAEASGTVGIRSELSIHPEALAVGTGCTGFQLSGDCSTLAVTGLTSPCTSLPTNLIKEITSVRISAGLFCVFHARPACDTGGGFIVATDTGIADFSNTFYGKVLVSYICEVA